MIQRKFKQKMIATALFALPMSIFAQQKIVAPIDFQYLTVAPQEKVLTAKNQQFDIPNLKCCKCLSH